MRVLVVNAGSSSLKLRLLAANDELVASTDLAAPADRLAVREAVADVAVDAVGHRIVHGGPDFSAAVPIDTHVEQRLRALAELAPLHQPKSLAALDLVRAVLPDVPHVAYVVHLKNSGRPGPGFSPDFGRGTDDLLHKRRSASAGLAERQAGRGLRAAGR